MPNRFLFVAIAASLAAVGCSSSKKAASIKKVLAAKIDNTEVAVYTVSASAGDGGSVTPKSLEVNDGETGTFTVSAAAGHDVDTVKGCGGSIKGTVYTTGAIHADCKVTATFRKLNYFVGGSVLGLAGTGLVLQNNGGDDLPISANGAFQFPAKATFGDPYQVTVKTNPTALAQTCSVQNNSGTVSGSVADVAVTCVTNAYAVGVTVSGLAGQGLLLRSNFAEELAVPNNGYLSFPTLFTDGTAYSLSVVNQPSAPVQTCTLTNAAGILAGANVTEQVSCVTEKFPVSVTVSGLTSGSLVLRDNGGDDLTLFADGTTAFATHIDDRAAFAVTVATQPGMIGRSCKVHNASGVLDGGPAYVWVACTNYGLRFAGGGDEVDFASPLTLPANGAPYTIEAWVNPDGMGNLGILAWGNYGSANQAIDLQLTTTGIATSWWGNVLAAAVPDLSHAWHHVATSWDGTTRRLFLDGVEVASDTPAPNVILDGSNLRLGRGFNNDYFQGAIDSVRIWGTAITAGALADWRSTDVLDDHPDRAALLAAWSFRAGAGSAVTEDTGKSAYLGTLQGGTTWERVMPSVALSTAAIRFTSFGATAAVTATAENEYHRAVTVTSWSSDTAAVAGVSGTGNDAVVTAGSIVGATRIYASSDEGASARVFVYVRGASNVIRVDYMQTTATETGAIWSRAFASLADALAVAVSGDEIWVRQGTYTPSAGTERAASFHLKNGVNVFGGFQGTESLRSQANPALYVTVLSGGLVGGQAKSYHVVEAVGSTATLDGFTVRGGLADNALLGRNLGAGLYIQGSALTLGRLTLEWNQAAKGGAIYAADSTLTVTDSYFNQNTASTGGGGFSISGGSLTLNSSTFTGNTSGGGDGGGLRAENADSLTLNSDLFDGNTAQNGGGAYVSTVAAFAANLVTFQNNAAGSYGGGLNGYQLSGTLAGLTFLNNTSVDGGGGLYMSSPYMVGYAPAITDAIFDGNQSRAGGGMAVVNTTPIVHQSVFRNNSVVSSTYLTPVGGAVYLQTESPLTNEFVNVTFSGNTATMGGAVYGPTAHARTRVRFANVTFAGNYASSLAGAMYYTGGELVMQNSIMWDNRAGTGDNLVGTYSSTYGPASSVTLDSSLISGGCGSLDGNYSLFPGMLTCTNILTGDPLFVLSPVGVDGLAGTSDDVTGDLQLQAGSAALDVGDNSVFSGIVSPVDLAGNPRIVNTTVDLGAYEKQ